MNQKGSKTILLILLLVILAAPMLQGLFHFFPESKLSGAYVEPEKPGFELDSFLTGNFQKKWEAYEDYNYGFRGVLIKLKNAVEYILFTEIDNGDIIEGRNGYLYSRGSALRTIKGEFYNGKAKNESTVSRINLFKDWIEARGGHLMVVVVPSKEFIIPENLPASFDNAVAQNSDYRDFIAGYKKNDIPYIDLCRYFKALYPGSPYQLFTKTGFHWSVYGASVAQDTILKYCQALVKEPMAYYLRKGVEWSDTARGADADFEEVMNLPFSLQQPRYVYPKLEMAESAMKNKRPKVIIIGDSFFWQIKNLKNLANIFSEDSRFWYYFKTSFPLNDDPGIEIKDLDVMTELANADFVILAGSLGTLGDFPFGVTDHYEDYYSNKEKIQGEGKAKKSFYLRASNGKYVCADGDRDNGVFANRDSAGSWETFSLYPLDDNKCAIASHQHKFLSAELGQQNEITATRSKIAGWETFTMVNIDSNHVAFTAANGKYLTLDERTMKLFASGETIGKQERFKMLQK